MELYGEVKYKRVRRTPASSAPTSQRAAPRQPLPHGHPTAFVPVLPGGGWGAQPICTAREPHSTRAGSGGAEDTIRILLWLLLGFDQCAEHAAFGMGVRLAYRRTLRLDFSINT